MTDICQVQETSQVSGIRQVWETHNPNWNHPGQNPNKPRGEGAGVGSVATPRSGEICTGGSRTRRRSNK